jgi:hypothetical protein
VVPGYCTCENAGCYSSYRQVYGITADWQQIAVRWADLRQLPWGYHANFDTFNVVGIGFAGTGEDWDFWVDDVGLTPE